MPLMILWLAAAAAPLPPADVTAFLSRREQCEHWGGEEAYDKARGKQIDAAMRRLRCDTMDADEARLRRLYVRTPKITALLDAAADE
jgi:hypothetical protein